MSLFADLVRFVPTAGGTGNWVYSSAVGGCQSPTAANAQNGASYKVYAVSADLTQWEISTGVYTSSTGTFARTTVLYNSSGTGTAAGQSGAGTLISFNTVPQVSVVALAEDLGSPGQFPGTPTNDNANAGNIGEYLSATVLWGSGVALTSGVQKTVTSITLTPGDWDVTGVIGFDPGSGVTLTAAYAFISLTSNSTPAQWPTSGGAQWAGSTTGGSVFVTTDINRIVVPAGTTTTVYLVAQGNFAGGTEAASGVIRARRMR